MNPPDQSVPDLLRSYLQASEQVTELRNRLDKITDFQVEEVGDRQEGDKQLHDRIDVLVEQLADPQQAAAASAWADTATDADWKALVTWVDWLTETYQLPAERRIQPCWPRHGGAVEELAGLHAAWQAATIKNPLASALTDWHEVLARALARVPVTFGMRSCTESHREAVALRGTDPAGVPVVGR